MRRKNVHPSAKTVAASQASSCPRASVQPRETLRSEQITINAVNKNLGICPEYMLGQCLQRYLTLLPLLNL